MNSNNKRIESEKANKGNQPEKSNKKPPYVFVLDDVQKMENEFEETRRCLINSYHSDVQAHVSYLLILAIGGLTLVSGWRSFFISFREAYFLYPEYGVILFFSVLIFYSAIYFGSRIIYWTMYANCVMTVTLEDAVEEFMRNNSNSKNKHPFTSKPSYMIMIQMTVAHIVFGFYKGTLEGAPKIPFWRKSALKIARIKNPETID